MAIKVEKRLSHIKTPLDISVMGCVVNALGEAKHADMAIAFGNRSGLIIKEVKSFTNWLKRIYLKLL